MLQAASSIFLRRFFAPTRLVGEQGSFGVTAGNIRTISTSTSRLALGEKPTGAFLIYFSI